MIIIGVAWKYNNVKLALRERHYLPHFFGLWKFYSGNCIGISCHWMTKFIYSVVIIYIRVWSGAYPAPNLRWLFVEHSCILIPGWWKEINKPIIFWKTLLWRIISIRWRFLRGITSTVFFTRVIFSPYGYLFICLIFFLLLIYCSLNFLIKNNYVFFDTLPLIVKFVYIYLYIFILYIFFFAVPIICRVR